MDLKQKDHITLILISVVQKETMKKDSSSTYAKEQQQSRAEQLVRASQDETKNINLITSTVNYFYVFSSA